MWKRTIFFLTAWSNGHGKNPFHPPCLEIANTCDLIQLGKPLNKNNVGWIQNIGVPYYLFDFLEA